MKKKDFAVVDVDRAQVTITLAGVDEGRAVIRSCSSFVRPAEVDFFDGAAVGGWIREKLRDAGTLGARVVLSLPRGEVVIKRLVLPVAENVAQEDVVGAVRLQMSRQLSVSAEASAIDFIPIPPGGGGGQGAANGAGGSAEAGMQTVTAAALPGERMDWCRALARSAGIKLARIGLRCFGGGHVLAAESQRRDGAVMGVIPSASSVEFVVVEAGQLMLARAVDIPWPTESESAVIDAYAERVAVEAKRTWMSHRAAAGQLEVQAVIVLGDGPAAEKLAQRCGAGLERPGVTLLPAGASRAKGEEEPGSSIAAASVGLLLEADSKRPYLDFLHPRKAPDRAARRRQVALAGAFLVILGIGSPIVFAQLRIAALDDELRHYRQITQDRQAELNEMWSEDARLKNLETWSSVKVDWVAHIGALSEQVPSPPEALIDGLNGTVNAQVDFTAKGGQYAGGTWKNAQTSSLTISGRVKQRETAASLRGRLAAGEIYSVESPSPDTGDRFSFQLFTPYAKPEKPPAPAKEPGKNAKQGEKSGEHGADKGAPKGADRAGDPAGEKAADDSAKTGGAQKPAGGAVEGGGR